jgi:copper resistance protein D
MTTLYFTSVTLHVLAALVWLGGMFFLALVGGPVLRGVEPPQLRAALYRGLGRRFRTVGWMAIAVLLITGVVNLWYRGLMQWSLLSTPEFWSTNLGRALGWKLATVALMLLFSALHDFVFGPRSVRLAPGSAEAVVNRRWSAWMARINAGVGLVLVIAAVRLARGG